MEAELCATHHLCAMHRAMHWAWEGSTGPQCLPLGSWQGSRHHRNSHMDHWGCSNILSLFLLCGDTEGSHRPEDMLSPLRLEGVW